ncbi:MAG: hypothetical protein H0X14_09270 [Acidobacteria bacterium]|nr:hypothetical protein [Acidobacteriota bacterium]
MQEAKDPKSTGTSGGENTSTESKDPKSDATSDETLSDLEETGKVSGDESKEGSAPSSPPSPDGAFDEGGGRGPREDPGPM